MSDPHADPPDPRPARKHLNGSSRHPPAVLEGAAPTATPPAGLARVVASEKVALALALASGVAMFLGFAGFDVWPLQFVSMAPLLVALRGRPPKRAFLLGWLMGTVSVGGGFYWIVGMLKTFSGFPIPLCVLFALLLWAAQGLQFGVITWLVARGDARGVSRFVTVPAALAAVELAFPLLFPWYTSNSLHTVPLLIQTADLGGPILISAALALGWAALDAVVASDRPWPARLRPLAVPAAFWVFALPYGAWRIHQVNADTSGPAIRVGIVQQNLGLMQKRHDPYVALSRHLEASRALERQGAELIVWSESAIAFRIPEDTRNIRDYIPVWDLHTPVLFGALSVRGRRVYNTAFVTDATGTLRGTYDKVYLLAFGEYLPFGETFPVLYDWSPNSGRFTPGSQFHALPVPGGRVMPLICYEDILPRFVNKFQQQADAGLLAVILNDAWFGDTAEPWIHNALAKFRAVEHRRDLIRAANSGVSSIIDPAGRTVAHGGTFTRENVVGTVRVRSGATPYRYVGDWAGWLGLAVAIYLTVPSLFARLIGVFRKR